MPGGTGVRGLAADPPARSCRQCRGPCTRGRSPRLAASRSPSRIFGLERHCVPCCTIALILAGRLDHLPAFEDVVRCRLLDVHVLAGLAGPDRRQRVPVVGRGERNGVDRLVVEHRAIVGLFRRPLARLSPRRTWRPAPCGRRRNRRASRSRRSAWPSPAVRRSATRGRVLRAPPPLRAPDRWHLRPNVRSPGKPSLRHRPTRQTSSRIHVVG